MKKFIIVFIFFVISSNSFAENKIVYLDVSLLLNESIVGQNLNKKLKEINNKNITEFKAIETNIPSNYLWPQINELEIVVSQQDEKSVAKILSKLVPESALSTSYSKANGKSSIILLSKGVRSCLSPW